MRKLSFGIAVALAAALTAVAVGRAAPDTTTAAPSYSLTIGDMLQLTGSGAPFGPPYQRAAELALAQIQKAIKANKLNIQVNLIHADNETTPQGAVNAGQKLVAGGASCIAGPNTSDAVIAEAQSVNFPMGVPEIADGASSDQITNMDRHGLLYRLYPADKQQAALLSRVIKQRFKGSKGKMLSVAGANTPFGAGFAAEFAKDWKALGGKVNGPVLYDPNALAYDSEAQKLSNANPAGYVIIDNIGTTSFAKLSGALLRTGKFSGSKLFLGGGQSAQAPANTPVQALEGAEGLRPNPPSGSAAYKAFLKLYNSSPNPPQMQVFTQNNFDAVIMCFLGSLAARSAKGTDIAKHLRAVSAPPGKAYTWLQLRAAVKALATGKDIDFQGVSGNIDWNAQGDVKAGIWAAYQYKNNLQTTISLVSANILNKKKG